MRSARASLLGVIASLSREDFGYARRGGWTIRRVVQHVIESEQVYAKLLAHQCGRTAADIEDRDTPDSPAAVEMRLAETRANVLAMIDGIEDGVLYGLVRVGHEEYSPLSVLENIALHDREHSEQIESLRASRAGAQPKRVVDSFQASAQGVAVREASVSDLPRITEIYNHYIQSSPATFDLVPFTVEQRMEWFGHYRTKGPHRLLVADSLSGSDGSAGVLGYAASSQFRTKPAYDTTVETTIYCAPDATGRGIGGLLYAALFDAIRDEELHVAIAGITVPNVASFALHERFGFRRVGLMPQVGHKFDRYWDVAWYLRELDGPEVSRRA